MFGYHGLVDITLTATGLVRKTDGHWQVRAHGNLYTFRYLDDAIGAALSPISRRDRARIVISVLQQSQAAFPDAA